MLRTYKFFIITLLFSFISKGAMASTYEVPLKEVDWHFEGMTGTFDKQAIQRGFKVFREVCSACHSLKRIAFRNLQEVGFSEEEVKAIASSYDIADGPDDEGEMFTRPGRPSDYFPLPFANEKAARAANNNNALPPDLSLIIKAREDGANYVYSLLTGYSEPPADFVLGENMHYNPYFAGGGKQFSMIPPLLQNEQVKYDDGTEATIEQMSKDVVNFLQWAAEPEMEQRKSLGFKVLIFLSIFTLVFYWAKVSIWRRIEKNNRP